MTVIGPYRLLRTLGDCEAGKVWSAFDAEGTSVTVALLDPDRAARDAAWLAGWQAGTDDLVRTGTIAVVASDLSLPTPWVACAWDEDIGAGRLFTARGLPYAPITNGAQAPLVAPPDRKAAKAKGRAKAVAPPVPPAVVAPPASKLTPVPTPVPVPVPVPVPEPVVVAPPVAPDAVPVPAQWRPEPDLEPAAAAVPVPEAAPTVEPPAPAATLMGQPPGQVGPAAIAEVDEAWSPVLGRAQVVPPAPAEAPTGEVPVVARARVQVEPSTLDVPVLTASALHAPEVEAPALDPSAADAWVVEAPVLPSAPEAPVVGRAPVSLPAPAGLAALPPLAAPSEFPEYLRPRGLGRAIIDPSGLVGGERRRSPGDQAPVPPAPPPGPVAAPSPPPSWPQAPPRSSPQPPPQSPPPQSPPPGPAKAKRGRGTHKRRRRGRAVLLTLLILLVLAGAGTAVAVRLGLVTLPLDARVATPTSAPVFLPPAALRGPGLEPPEAGDWPSFWSTFEETDQTKVMGDLSGVGFTFRVPEPWVCTPGGTGTEAATYFCGTVAGTDSVGGELTVRPCADQCDAGDRERMRRQEDAWALQWVRAGGYVTWAQTTALSPPSSYGLIVVGYWRSVPEGAIDRQVVLRLTAPKARASEVQKVANDVFTAISR